MKVIRSEITIVMAEGGYILEASPRLAGYYDKEVHSNIKSVLNRVLEMFGEKGVVQILRLEADREE